MGGDAADGIYLPAVAYLDDREFWLLQYSNGVEGIVVDGEHVPAYPTFELLADLANTLGLHIDEEDAMPVELDVVERWLMRPTLDTIDAAVFLDAWDLFADIARSLPNQTWEHDATTERVYERLFWGSTAFENEHHEMVTRVSFSGPEAVRLRQVMRRGLHLFRDHVVQGGAETKQP